MLIMGQETNNYILVPKAKGLWQANTLYYYCMYILLFTILQV